MNSVCHFWVNKFCFPSNCKTQKFQISKVIHEFKREETKRTTGYGDNNNRNNNSRSIMNPVWKRADICWGRSINKLSNCHRHCVKLRFLFTYQATTRLSQNNKYFDPPPPPPRSLPRFVQNLSSETRWEVNKTDKQKNKQTGKLTERWPRKSDNMRHDDNFN